MRTAIATLLLALGLFSQAIAQGANISLGTGGFDAGLPVEVTSDALNVDQQSGEAVFNGNVLVVQGEVRMSAARVAIEYSQNANAKNSVSRLLASGGVTFVTPTDAAEAREAVYTVADGTVLLTGDVLLTQGPSAISGDRMVIDLASGAGRMEGRVRTVFAPSGNGN